MEPRHSTPSGKRAIYYYTTWSQNELPVNSLPIDNLVDIALAFVWVDGYGQLQHSGAQTMSAIDGFRRLKNRGKKFNLTLAIGGWNHSTFFSTAFSSPDSRQRFVNSLGSFLVEHRIFNGVTIDWEYVTDNGQNYGHADNKVNSADGRNFVEVLRMLRQSFGSQGFGFGPQGQFTLSACCTGVPENARWPIEEAIHFLDELHLMTYDFSDGNWDRVAHHQANLMGQASGKSADRAVSAMLRRGVPAKKIFIGGALYCRGFSGTAGINKPATGPSPNAGLKYKRVDRSNEKWDEEAKAAYTYDPTSRVLDSYDTVKSMKEKAKYVFDKDLGGIIVWEASGDVPYGRGSIMRALHDNLTHP